MAFTTHSSTADPGYLDFISGLCWDISSFGCWLHCMRRVVKRKGSACRSRCFCCPGEACATYACNALILLCLRIAGLYSPCNTRVWTSVYAVPLSEYIHESDCQHELDQPTVLFVSTLKRWIWMLSVLFETGTHSRKIFSDWRFSMYSRKTTSLPNPFSFESFWYVNV